MLRTATFVNTTNHNSSDTLPSSWCYCPNVSTAPLAVCVFIEKYIRKEKNVRRWIFPRCDMEAIHKMYFNSVWKAFTVSCFDMFHWNYLSMLNQTCKEKKEDVFQTLQEMFLAFVHFLSSPLKKSFPKSKHFFYRSGLNEFRKVASPKFSVLFLTSLIIF